MRPRGLTVHPAILATADAPVRSPTREYVRAHQGIKGPAASAIDAATRGQFRLSRETPPASALRSHTRPATPASGGKLVNLTSTAAARQSPVRTDVDHLGLSLRRNSSSP